MSDLKTIGLIAGEGRLPVLYAESLQAAGIAPTLADF